MAVTQRICLHCDKPIPATADVRRRYCNGTCKAARCSAAALEDGRFDQWYQTSLARKRRSLTVSRCVVCSRPFSHISQVRRYCSNRCRTKASYEVRKQTPEFWAAHREDVRRRRARKKNAPVVERFTSSEIFERDGYRCHICRRRCRGGTVVPHPLAPTIDHLIPLAQQGDHTRANVATACFQCNSVKGDRGGGEQLAVI